MQTNYQKGQQISTPEGEGIITEIIGDQITVKLNSGDEKSYPAEDLDIEDEADQG